MPPSVALKKKKKKKASLFPGPGMAGTEFQLENDGHNILLALLHKAVPNPTSLLCAHSTPTAGPSTVCIVFVTVIYSICLP